MKFVVEGIFQKIKAIAALTQDLRFCPRHPHGDSLFFITPIAGGPTPSYGHCEHEACTWCTDKQSAKAVMIIYKSLLK